MEIIPITEFFEDEGCINKETYVKAEGERAIERIQRLKDLNIDTALFIFMKEWPEFLDGNVEEFYTFINASNKNPVYIYKNKFLIAFSALGGPNAAGIMEELGFLGIKNFFACGSAGQIDSSINGASFVLAERAIRDEGASYHYLTPSVYAYSDKELTDEIAKFLDENGFDYIRSTTWTTDAFFRETPKAIERRKSQGAVCVEMECASWCAVAKFRGYKFAQLLYFSDAVNQNWDWKPDKKELKYAILNLMIDLVSKYVEK